jgi:hypothetical protein
MVKYTVSISANVKTDKWKWDIRRENNARNT